MILETNYLIAVDVRLELRRGRAKLDVVCLNCKPNITISGCQ
jgi:hypothetical protein